MVALLGRELRLVESPIRANLHELAILCSAILFLAISENHSVGDRWSDALLYYAALPILVILSLRKNPLDFGLRPGDWRVWRFHVAVAVLVSIPVLLLASRAGSLRDYYIDEDLILWRYCLESIAYFAAWEFLFRGYLLFGLKSRFREAAILIQMIPFVLLHFGKPEIEVISTIPMGIYFGYVAYRGNSCWPAVIIHLWINVLFRVFVNYL
ncbi:MAG: CPBP family intramembrane metalloprotease [Chloroflexi bacterium]|nr:CPBP family intramembrane metalloprotease [Chloroflexota bacterium]